MQLERGTDTQIERDIITFVWTARHLIGVHLQQCDGSRSLCLRPAVFLCVIGRRPPGCAGGFSSRCCPQAQPPLPLCSSVSYPSGPAPRQPRSAPSCGQPGEGTHLEGGGGLTVSFVWRGGPTGELFGLCVAVVVSSPEAGSSVGGSAAVATSVIFSKSALFSSSLRTQLKPSAPTARAQRG